VRVLRLSVLLWIESSDVRILAFFLVCSYWS
jgi:hypothetical protein